MVVFIGISKLFYSLCFLFFISALLSLLPAIEAFACTTFFLKQDGNQVFGRNYDWDVEEALIIANKRGMFKRSYVRAEATGEAAAWRSKYGSVTFNQYGREFPTGGMNEAGLVVETMALSETRYPSPDRRPYLASSMQWRQYLLDNFASVDEVIKSDADVRISHRAPGLGAHYLISDRKGNCAAVEFLEGRMVVYTGHRLPVKVLTNDTYSESLYCWRKGMPPVFDPGRSMHRFIRASQMIANCKLERNESAIDYAFTILKKVGANRTVWSIVYDNINMKIYFRTKSHPKIRRIDMQQFNYSCNWPVQILDINAVSAGDVTRVFENYSREKNRKLIGNSFRKTSFLMKISDERLDWISRYPETHKCIP